MPPTTILTLPPELRSQIFSILLRNANNRVEPDEDDMQELDYEDPPSGPTYNFDLRIFRACRLFYSEALPVFQRVNYFIKVSTPFPGAISHLNNEGRVGLLCTGKPATDFTNFHLRVLISSPEYNPSSIEGPGIEDHSMITCLEDVERFTTTWLYSHLSSSRQLNEHLTLRLDLKNPYDNLTQLNSTLQSRLLAPFAQVKDLHDFSLAFHGGPFFPSGTIDPAIAEKLKREIAIPPPTPQQCLEACYEKRMLGHNEITKKTPEGYKAALQKYVEAFKDIHITIEGRKRRIDCDGFYNTRGSPATAPFKPWPIALVRLQLRVGLVSDTIHAYNLLGQHDEAWFWAYRSVHLFMSQIIGDMAIYGYDDTVANRSLGEDGRLVGVDWSDLLTNSLNTGRPNFAEMGIMFLRAAQAKAGEVLNDGYKGGKLVDEVWVEAQTVAMVQTDGGVSKWSVDLEQVEGLIYAAAKFAADYGDALGEIREFEVGYRKEIDKRQWSSRYWSDHMG